MANKKAKESFERAINIKNNFWEAYQNLGICYEKLNLNNEAINIFKKALEINNRNVNTIIKLSNLAMEDGNYSESEKYLHELENNENLNLLDMQEKFQKIKKLIKSLSK